MQTIIDGGCMLMALTAVAVMAWRVRPSWQLTIATVLASLRNASFVCEASCSFGVIAACISPFSSFLFCLTTYHTVRYNQLYLTVHQCQYASVNIEVETPMTR